MRRVVPQRTHVRLLRTRRTSARRRAAAVLRTSRCTAMDHAFPQLDISRLTDPGEDFRYRAKLGLSGAASGDSARLARAFTDMVVCASRTDPLAEAASLRRTAWTERGGNMVLEIRSPSSRVSSPGVARLVEPILEGYAAGALQAARLLGGREDVGMTVDVSRTSLAEGGVVVRVVLYGQAGAPAALPFVPPRVDSVRRRPRARLAMAG
jgi:hypothetical protein